MCWEVSPRISIPSNTQSVCVSNSGYLPLIFEKRRKIIIKKHTRIFLLCTSFCGQKVLVQDHPVLLFDFFVVRMEDINVCGYLSKDFCSSKAEEKETKTVTKTLRGTTYWPTKQTVPNSASKPNNPPYLFIIIGIQCVCKSRDDKKKKIKKIHLFFFFCSSACLSSCSLDDTDFQFCLFVRSSFFHLVDYRFLSILFCLV